MYTHIRVNVFGKGITLPGRSDVSQGVAGPCRLQLCAVLKHLSRYNLSIRNHRPHYSLNVHSKAEL